MPLRDDLLNPIAGDNPGGADLRYEPIYDQVKEARREDDDAPQGEWQHARKVADYALVLKLTGEALATKSKDLQLAAWLTEALVRREGFGGLRAGLELLRALLDQFWDHLYPELEDGDAELRASPLEWVGLRLDVPVKLVPLNRSGHDFFQYTESRALGYEADVADNSDKMEARQQAIADGKLPAEEFDKGFEATPKSWYKELVADIRASLDAVRALDDLGREKFGDDAPGYRSLREALEQVEHVAGLLLKQKLEIDPDPPEAEPVAAGDGAVGGDGAAGDGALAAAGARGPLAPEPTDPADAAARVIGAARFLRHADATSPVSYLMLRALRWGELLARGNPPDPRMLEAPTGASRVQLRRLMLDANWTQLLETAETVMATPAGRGWLDVQRYVVGACEGLGGEYERVATAIRAELRNLLVEIPELPGMSLMDDMPAANQETREWLRSAVAGQGGEVHIEAEVPDEPVESAPRTNGRDRSLDRAMAEVRGGHPERAIDVLMRELDREKSRRGRFLRQSQLARIMVDAGLEQVATPILEEMMGLIETHKLDEWEPGDLVAEPMLLLYKCIEKAEGDASTMRDLYLRICRLDPVRAIGVAKP